MKHTSKGSTLAFTSSSDITRSSKQGYQWPIRRTNIRFCEPLFIIRFLKFLTMMFELMSNFWWKKEISNTKTAPNKCSFYAFLHYSFPRIKVISSQILSSDSFLVNNSRSPLYYLLLCRSRLRSKPKHESLEEKNHFAASTSDLWRELNITNIQI